VQALLPSQVGQRFFAFVMLCRHWQIYFGVEIYDQILDDEEDSA